MKAICILVAIVAIHAMEIYGNFSNFNFFNFTQTNCTTINGKKNCTNTTYPQYASFYGIYEPTLMTFAGDLTVTVYYPNYTYYATYNAPLTLLINKTFSSSIGQYNFTMAIDFLSINAGTYAGSEIYMYGKGTYTQYGAMTVGRVSYIDTEPWTYVSYSNVSWAGGIYYNGTNMTDQ